MEINLNETTFKLNDRIFIVAGLKTSAYILDSKGNSRPNGRVILELREAKSE